METLPDEGALALHSAPGVVLVDLRGLARQGRLPGTASNGGDTGRPATGQAGE
jgi:hypothetical protein